MPTETTGEADISGVTIAGDNVSVVNPASGQPSQILNQAKILATNPLTVIIGAIVVIAGLMWLHHYNSKKNG